MFLHNTCAHHHLVLSRRSASGWRSRGTASPTGQVCGSCAAALCQRMPRCSQANRFPFAQGGEPVAGASWHPGASSLSAAAIATNQQLPWLHPRRQAGGVGGAQQHLLRPHGAPCGWAEAGRELRAGAPCGWAVEGGVLVPVCIRVCTLPERFLRLLLVHPSVALLPAGSRRSGRLTMCGCRSHCCVPDCAGLLLPAAPHPLLQGPQLLDLFFSKEAFQPLKPYFRQASRGCHVQHTATAGALIHGIRGRPRL